MKNAALCLALSVAVTSTDIFGASDDIFEDFNGATISPLLMVPAGYRFGDSAQPVGSIQNVNDIGYRPVVATVAADFNIEDFLYEITATVRAGGPQDAAFIGIGGNVSPSGFAEPNTSVYFRIFPTGFGGTVDLSVSSDPSNWDPPIFLSPSRIGEGTYRVQIKKTGPTITFGCMTNFTGQPFVAHYSISKNITNDFPFLTESNSRLFFGVQGNQTTFDDLSIQVSCTPHRATATPVVVNGFVVGAVLDDPGCGYTNAPLVLIRGGGGQGATATATIVDGKVTAIQILSAGCCYTNTPRIEIASPPFVPTVDIAVSRVTVKQNVVLGWKYVLESSTNNVHWIPTGPEFIAESESIVQEFDVSGGNRFFRLRVVP